MEFEILNSHCPSATVVPVLVLVLLRFRQHRIRFYFLLVSSTVYSVQCTLYRYSWTSELVLPVLVLPFYTSSLVLDKIGFQFSIKHRCQTGFGSKHCVAKGFRTETLSVLPNGLAV
jgi:hypothetical protein